MNTVQPWKNYCQDNIFTNFALIGEIFVSQSFLILC